MTEHQHQKLSSLSATAKTNFYISALTALRLSDCDSDTTNRWIKTGKLYSQKCKLSTSMHDSMICSSQSGQIGRLAGNTDSELLKHKAPATYRSMLRLTMPTSAMVPRMHFGLNAPATSPTIMARFHSALYATSMNICTQARCSISLGAFHNCPEYLHIDSPLYFTPLSSQPNASPTLWTECCKQGWLDLPGQTCW